ncbi:hypothetical protein A4G19_03460 [Pasteurellaceae bacterium Macca]|nr:hypothetical protein [Pasteurellaceae bacterium Macca]
MNYIILAANQKYVEHMITTIKSVLYHNLSTTELRFYVLNKNIPNEVFEILNKELNCVGVSIIDAKVINNEVAKFNTLPHISSETTYFRYFIQEIFNTPDIPNNVLYLDCDLVVNGDISELFQIELKDNYVTASKDFIAENNLENYLSLNGNYFNVGVLLINLPLWKQDNVARKCMDLSKEIINKVKFGDQDILNLVFKDRWLKANRFFNYQLGGDFVFGKDSEIIEKLPGNQIPLITHWNTEAKPWLANMNIRFRELYWQYYALSWEEIRQKYNV